MVIDIGKQQRAGAAVDDQPQILTGPRRPESRILRRIDAVERQAGAGGIGLQIKRRILHRLLLRRREAGERGGEGFGDAEDHVDVVLLLAYRHLASCAPARADANHGVITVI